MFFGLVNGLWDIFWEEIDLELMICYEVDEESIWNMIYFGVEGMSCVVLWVL